MKIIKKLRLQEWMNQGCRSIIYKLIYTNKFNIKVILEKYIFINNLEIDGSIPHFEIESLLIKYFLKIYIYNPCKIKIMKILLEIHRKI